MTKMPILIDELPYIAIPKQNVTLTVFLKAQMAELINAAF
jgi:hypothetical protein